MREEHCWTSTEIYQINPDHFGCILSPHIAPARSLGGVSPAHTLSSISVFHPGPRHGKLIEDMNMCREKPRKSATVLE